MAVVTPGVDFIVRNLVTLSIPPTLLAVALRALTAAYDLPLPTWLVISGSILSVPLIIAVRIISKSLYEKRRAAALGARLAPQIQGKSIGNFDILGVMRDLWDTGYPGKCSYCQYPCAMFIFKYSGWND